MTKRKLKSNWEREDLRDQDIESFEKIRNRKDPRRLMSTRQLKASLKTAASRRLRNALGRRQGGRRNKRYFDVGVGGEGMIPV